MTNSSESPLISQPGPTTSVTSDNPLQKLLYNLQRGNQGTPNTNTTQVFFLIFIDIFSLILLFGSETFFESKIFITDMHELIFCCVILS